MKTHADPSRRKLSAAALDEYKQDDCHPRCRLCGKLLRVGDWVDPFHPWEHRGNLCTACEQPKPKENDR